MFDELLQYGMAGIFIAYLIYDRQVIMRKLIDSIDRLNASLSKMRSR